MARVASQHIRTPGRVVRRRCLDVENPERRHQNFPESRLCLQYWTSHARWYVKNIIFGQALKISVSKQKVRPDSELNGPILYEVWHIWKKVSDISYLTQSISCLWFHCLGIHTFMADEKSREKVVSNGVFSWHNAAYQKTDKGAIFFLLCSQLHQNFLLGVIILTDSYSGHQMKHQILSQPLVTPTSINIRSC